MPSSNVLEKLNPLRDRNSMEDDCNTAQSRARLHTTCDSQRHYPHLAHEHRVHLRM